MMRKVPPELSVLANGHHDQQVSQDTHQHDQRQEADQSHLLWHAVTMDTTKIHGREFTCAERNFRLYLLQREGDCLVTGDQMFM